MIVNGVSLWDPNVVFKPPIKDMVRTKIREHGVSYGLSEAGYDVRIAQEVTFYYDGCDPYVRITFPEDQISQYENGSFTLASTIEQFDMPSNLVGIVHDKSTWARKGLSVFNTVIEPGFCGGLTLELYYRGHEPLVIPAGAGIAQVIFHKTMNNASYNGKYQNQDSKPVEAIFSN